jgi:hypothetical protein
VCGGGQGYKLIYDTDIRNYAQLDTELGLTTSVVDPNPKESSKFWLDQNPNRFGFGN